MSDLAPVVDLKSQRNFRRVIRKHFIIEVMTIIIAAQINNTRFFLFFFTQLYRRCSNASFHRRNFNTNGVN